MTKRELLEMLKDVDMDTPVFPVASGYIPGDDMTWGTEYMTEFVEVKNVEGDIYLVLEAEEFMS